MPRGRKIVTGSAIALAVLLLPVTGFNPISPAQATSEDECAIWLCLPGGFPSGCGSAESAFEKRLKKGKSPLPAWGSCSAGTSQGGYTMGYDPFEDCAAGYTAIAMRGERGSGTTGRQCIDPSACRSVGRDEELQCESYMAARRAKPRWIDMWAGAEHIGKFWY